MTELNKLVYSMGYNRLNKTIEKFSSESSEQTKQMIRLNRVVAGLTVVMTIGLVIQILIQKSIL